MRILSAASTSSTPGSQDLPTLGSTGGGEGDNHTQTPIYTLEQADRSPSFKPRGCFGQLCPFCREHLSLLLCDFLQLFFLTWWQIVDKTVNFGFMLIRLISNENNCLFMKHVLFMMGFWLMHLFSGTKTAWLEVTAVIFKACLQYLCTVGVHCHTVFVIIYRQFALYYQDIMADLLLYACAVLILFSIPCITMNNYW